MRYAAWPARAAAAEGPTGLRGIRQHMEPEPEPEIDHHQTQHAFFTRQQAGERIAMLTADEAAAVELPERAGDTWMDLGSKQRIAAVGMSGDGSVRARVVADTLLVRRVVTQAEVDSMLAWARDASSATQLRVPEGSPPRSAKRTVVPPEAQPRPELAQRPNAAEQRAQLMGVFLRYSKLTSGDGAAVHAQAAVSATRSIADATLSLPQWLALGVTAGLLRCNRSSLHAGRTLYHADTADGTTTGGNRGEANFRDFRRMLFQLAMLNFKTVAQSSEHKYRRAVERVVTQPVPDCLPDWAITRSRTRSAANLSQPPRCYHATANGRGGCIDAGIQLLYAHYSQESGVMHLSNWKALCDDAGIVRAATSEGSGSVSLRQASVFCKLRMAEVVDAFFETATGMGSRTATATVSKPEGLTVGEFRRALHRVGALCCGSAPSGQWRSPSEATAQLLRHMLQAHATKLARSSGAANIGSLRVDSTLKVHSLLSSSQDTQLSSWQSMDDDDFFDVVVRSLRAHAKQAQLLAHEATGQAKSEEQKMRAKFAWGHSATATEQDGETREKKEQAEERKAENDGSASNRVELDNAPSNLVVRATSELVAALEEDEDEQADW